MLMDYCPPPSTPDSEWSLSWELEGPSDSDENTIPEAFKIAQRNRITYAELKYMLKKSTMNFFVYGSLQLPREIALCLNKDKVIHDDEDVSFAMRMTPATLPYHRVYAIKDRIFPAILDDGTEHDVVDGMLLFGLDEAERQRFDRREGGWYSREERSVYIRMASGDEQVIRAYVYIWAHGSEHLINRDEKIWSLEEYMHERKKAPGARPSEEKDQAAYEKSIDEMRKRNAARDEQRRKDLLVEDRRRERRKFEEEEKLEEQERILQAARQRRMKAGMKAEEQRREKAKQKEHIYEDSTSDSWSDSEDLPNEAENSFKGFDRPSEILEMARPSAGNG